TLARQGSIQRNGNSNRGPRTGWNGPLAGIARESIVSRWSEGPDDSEARALSLWVAALVAVGMFFFAWKSRRAYLELEELEPALEDVPTGSVTVIIPARNEA